jgi:cysteine-rich repeat protein
MPQSFARWAALAALSAACGGGPSIELLSREVVVADAGRDEPGKLVPAARARDAWFLPDASFSPGTEPRLVDSDGDGYTDAEEIFLGTNPMGEGGECAFGSYSAVQRKRAVDIMLVVDNSSSMDEYIKAIVARINHDFAAILAEAEVDYRVIVISRHGAVDHSTGNACDDHGVCIEPPLAAGACDPNAPPKETERFKHYSVCIDSTDALVKVRRAFDGTEVSRYFSAPRSLATIAGSAAGFQQWLRDGAFRTFIIVSDDDSEIRDTDFVHWLYSLDPRYFGTAAEPNWRFHSIVNLAENPNDPYAAWAPGAGLVEQGCWDDTNRWIGADYQRLSMQSGGLRFPYCRNDNYNAVFRSVAASVTESATLPCTFAPTQTTEGGSADFSRVLVVYESGRFKRTLTRVARRASCVDDGFYVLDGEIKLCPLICDEVASDADASIKTLVACFDEATCGDGKLDAGETCDDGNRIDDDGCDDGCSVELI